MCVLCSTVEGWLSGFFSLFRANNNTSKTACSLTHAHCNNRDSFTELEYIRNQSSSNPFQTYHIAFPRTCNLLSETTQARTKTSNKDLGWNSSKFGNTLVAIKGTLGWMLQADLEVTTFVLNRCNCRRCGIVVASTLWLPSRRPCIHSNPPRGRLEQLV